MAAIGNLSEQAGFALKKVLGCPLDGPTFFRETEKEFPIFKLHAIVDWFRFLISLAHQRESPIVTRSDSNCELDDSIWSRCPPGLRIATSSMLPQR